MSLARLGVGTIRPWELRAISTVTRSASGGAVAAPLSISAAKAQGMADE